MVDDQIRGHERVDAGRVAAQLGHRVAHGRQVHHGRYAGEVLQDDPSRHERDLHFGGGGGARPPRGQSYHIGVSHDPLAGVPKHVLEEDLDRHRQARQVERRLRRPGQGGERVVVRQSGPERAPGAERIAGSHDSSFYEQPLVRSGWRGRGAGEHPSERT